MIKKINENREKLTYTKAVRAIYDISVIEEKLDDIENEILNLSDYFNYPGTNQYDYAIKSIKSVENTKQNLDKLIEFLEWFTQDKNLVD